MEHQLTRGCALVLTGPQGCGKTILARKIAEAHGSWREIDAMKLDLPFDLGAALDGEPNTLIVEGFPEDDEGLRRVKSMLTSEMLLANRKYQSPKHVKAPHFIFCSGDVDALKLGQDDRRFRVVRVG